VCVSLSSKGRREAGRGGGRTRSSGARLGAFGALAFPSMGWGAATAAF
jgi:hypothetical protein